MAIELISTAVPKNKGNFPIVLSNDIQGGIHYAETTKDRDNIPESKVQKGMLCYVNSTKSYHMCIDMRIDEEGKILVIWEEFLPSAELLKGDKFHNHENKETLDTITDDMLNLWSNKVEQDTLDNAVAEIEKKLFNKVGKKDLANVESRLETLINEKTFELDDTYHRIFRVDIDDEINQILDLYGNAVGTGSMAFVKSTKNTYLYLGDEWVNLDTFSTKIHIGNTPPEDKTMVWIDTSDDVINDVIIETGSNNLILQTILDSIKELRKDVDTIKAIIKNGGNIEWPDDDNDNDEPTETVTYIVDETGEYIFITEDGNYIIDELVEYTEPEKPIILTSRLCLENGDFFITESGDYIVDESDTEIEEKPEVPPVVTVSNKLIGETGDTLITENGDIIIQEM